MQRIIKSQEGSKLDIAKKVEPNDDAAYESLMSSLKEPDISYPTKTKDQVIKEKSELKYYADQLNKRLRDKNPQGFDELINKYGSPTFNPLTRVAGADAYAKNKVFGESLTPEEAKEVLKDKWDRYNQLKSQYGKDFELFGTNEQGLPMDRLLIGARHAVAFSPIKLFHTLKSSPEDKGVGLEYSVAYDPNSPTKYITKVNKMEKGGILELFKEGGKPKLMKKGGKKWIQKAVNPKHKGYCTPMTKATCTPRRKALAMTFKKMAKKRKHENGGILEFINDLSND